MKNLKYIIALLVVTVALFSCDSDVTIDDPKAESVETIDIIADNGNQGQVIDDGEDD